MKRVLALSAAAAMVFAACGSSDSAEEVVDDATEAVDDAVTTDATDEAPTTDAMEEGEVLIDTLNVAYFAEWPTPNQIGQEDGSFAAAVGAAEINWLPFASGGEMSEAMESGDVDISYSQGLTPFANTVNNGADLKLVGIAVTYAEADNCVAQGSLGVTRDNAAEVLNGATVMTPIGNVTNFKMLSTMEFLGVDLDSLTILPAEGGPTTAAAFEAGQIDVGCAFGGSLVSMIEDSAGQVILTGEEQATDVGIETYDIVSIPTSFGEANPQVVTNFLRATQDFNDIWAADPEGNNPIIAQAAGMEDVGNFLGGPVWFGFPTLEEQTGEKWLGGGVAENMKAQLATFVELGQIERALEDFSGFVDPSYLEAANS